MCSRTSSARLLAAAIALAPVGAAAQGANPAALFSEAYAAFQEGDAESAVRGYSEAAELGHLPAAWKLARMHESGDGVEQSDAEAFAAYERIARRFGRIRPRDREAVYVSSAFLHLAHYLRTGIDPVLPADPVAARRAYFYAASYFGDADAQFELGRMMLSGSGGRQDGRNGLRWLNSAAQKGHVGATARLGAALYHGEGIAARPVEGLSMLMQAAGDAREADRSWIEGLRDEALATATREIAAAAKARNEEAGS